MSERLLNMLGLMRKASSIEIGETNTGIATRGGKTKLLVLAADASDKAVKAAAGTALAIALEAGKANKPTKVLICRIAAA